MKRPSKTLTEQLRQAIDDCGLSRYQIAKETGIDESALAKFYNGHRGLSLDALNALGESRIVFDLGREHELSAVQASGQHQFIAEVKQVKTSTVNLYRKLHVLPRDHNKEIQKQPPGQQQGKIERSSTDCMILLSLMRLNRNSCHHGHNVQEKNHVAAKRIGYLMSPAKLEVRPHYLRRQPSRQAKGHQHPEQTSSACRGFDADKKSNSRKTKNGVLEDVTKCCESKAAGYQKRHRDMQAHEYADRNGPLSPVLEPSTPHKCIVRL